MIDWEREKALGAKIRGIETQVEIEERTGKRFH